MVCWVTCKYIHSRKDYRLKCVRYDSILILDSKCGFLDCPVLWICQNYLTKTCLFINSHYPLEVRGEGTQRLKPSMVLMILFVLGFRCSDIKNVRPLQICMEIWTYMLSGFLLDLCCIHTCRFYVFVGFLQYLCCYHTCRCYVFIVLNFYFCIHHNYC